MTRNASQQNPRNPKGEWRRKRPWERRGKLQGGAVAYTMDGGAAEYIDRFWAQIQPVVLNEWDFPSDAELPEEQLPQPGVYRLVVFPHIYFIDVDRVFKTVPAAPRWRVRGRLINGPLTEQGKRPLVAMTLAQFNALKPVYLPKEGESG